MLRFAAVMMLLIGTAHARVEPGNWEFSVESPLQQGSGGGPVTKQRCISADEASDPQKVLAEARGKNDCQLSNLRDSGSEYSFDLECKARIPLKGSGAVRYTPRSLDGEIDLVGEAQGLRLKTRSFVSGRRLGPCNSNK
jgi:hypothetical protein